jgi:protein SCO1/2
MRYHAALLVFLVGLWPAAPSAHDARPSVESGEFTRWAYAQSQGAVGRQVQDLTLRDVNGRSVTFAELRGRPLLVSFIYTSCEHTCPLITQNLQRAVRAAQGVLGPETFAVATIGFDTRNDTPVAMRQFARAQGVDLPGWRFLSADSSVIDRLSDDLGFVYYASARGFDHLAQVTLLDADGRVYRQIYGSAFDPPAVIEPLKELVLGGERSLFELSGLLDRFKLFCTYYDPLRDAYQADYGVIVSLIGMLTSFVAGLAYVLREWVRRRRLSASG